MSRPPYQRPKIMKRQPCLCPSPLIDCWTFSIKRSFGPVICIPAGHVGEWKRSIGESLCTFYVSLTYPYNTSSQGIKSDFLQIPRIGVQDGKIEIPQTLSQQSPLETILENTRLSSFDSIFSKIMIFFNFHLREAFKPPKNVLDTLASWMETETNTITFLPLNNDMILPFYLNVVTISKDFNLTF